MTVFGVPRYVSIVFFVACGFLTACAPKPTDAFSTALLEDVSNSIDDHYISLIASPTSASCRFDAPENVAFWKETQANMRVLVARVNYWPENAEMAEEVTLFQEALSAAREKEILALEDPTRLEDNRLWPCLDADEAAKTWNFLSTSLSDLIDVSKIETF